MAELIPLPLGLQPGDKIRDGAANADIEKPVISGEIVDREPGAVSLVAKVLEHGGRHDERGDDPDKETDRVDGGVSNRRAWLYPSWRFYG